MRNGLLSVGLVVLAVVFAILAVLYATGTLTFLTSDGLHQPHWKHTVLFVILALLSLVGANFARQRRRPLNI